MRYNLSALYLKYYYALRKEEKLQQKYYNALRSLQSKINELQNKIIANEDDLSSEDVIETLIEYNEEMNKYCRRLESSKERKRYFEQVICYHDFGIVFNTEYDDDKEEIYSSGICLECGKHFSHHEGNIFNHNIVLNSEVAESIKLKEFRNKLKEFIDSYGYKKSHYNYEIGETIVDEMVSYARRLS